MPWGRADRAEQWLRENSLRLAKPLRPSGRKVKDSQPDSNSSPREVSPLMVPGSESKLRHLLEKYYRPSKIGRISTENPH